MCVPYPELILTHKRCDRCAEAGVGASQKDFVQRLSKQLRICLAPTLARAGVGMFG